MGADSFLGIRGADGRRHFNISFGILPASKSVVSIGFL
jgi:hypothetical protein